MSFCRIQWEGSARQVSVPCGLSIYLNQRVLLKKSLEDHPINYYFRSFGSCGYHNYHANDIGFHYHISVSSNGHLPKSKSQY
jgi:hypothetical protein